MLVSYAVSGFKELWPELYFADEGPCRQILARASWFNMVPVSWAVSLSFGPGRRSWRTWTLEV